MENTGARITFFSYKNKEILNIYKKHCPKKGADMYDLPKLKNLCEAELCQKITKKNVGQMLAWAESFNLKILKTMALNIATSSWTQLESSLEEDIIIQSGLLKLITGHFAEQHNVIRPWKPSLCWIET